jgi:hypothetical protein
MRIECRLEVCLTETIEEQNFMNLCSLARDSHWLFLMESSVVVVKSSDQIPIVAGTVSGVEQSSSGRCATAWYRASHRANAYLLREVARLKF